jgi:hypothetical protein
MIRSGLKVSSDNVASVEIFSFLNSGRSRIWVPSGSATSPHHKNRCWSHQGAGLWTLNIMAFICKKTDFGRCIVINTNRNQCCGSGSGIRWLFGPGSGIRDGKNSDPGWTSRLRNTDRNNFLQSRFKIPTTYVWLNAGIVLAQKWEFILFKE